jgi:multiple sugar transport system substrate-binding protein
MKLTRLLVTSVLIFCAAFAAFATGQGEPAAAAQTQNLVFWHSYSQKERIDALQVSIDAFKKTHPNVTITTEMVPWNAFYQKWVSANEAKTLPDFSTALLNQALLMYKAGATQPVDKVLSAVGGPQAFLSKTIESLKFQGSYVGVPHYAHARLFWYRKDLVEQAGIKSLATWDDLKSAAQKLHNPPAMHGFVVPLADASPADIYLYLFIRTNGGDLYDKDGNVKINSRETREAIQYLMDLNKAYSPQGSLTYNTNELKAAFITGRTPFIIEAPFMISDTIRGGGTWASPKTLAGVPVPKKTQDAWMSEIIALVMMKTTKYPDTVSSFLKFTFSEEQYVPFLHSMPGGQLPTIVSVSKGSRFFEQQIVKDYRDSIQYAIQGIENGTPVAMTQGPNLWAAVIDGEEVLPRMLQDIATGKKSIDQSLTDTEARMRKIVSDTK